MGLALMEEVERINAVMVCSQQRKGFVQHNLYAMEVDRSNRNCYSCGGFRHLNYRNRGMGGRIEQGKRLEYGGNENNRQRRIEEENEQQNLNGEQDLILLD